MRTKHLPIADPCHEDWNAMDPVQRGRFCQVCVKQVFDMTAMTEREARDLLREHAGRRICVRYRHDGERLRFREASPAAPPPPAMDRTCDAPRRTAWAGMAAAAVVAMSMAACTPHERPQPTVDTVEVESQVMGSMLPTIPSQTETETRLVAGEIEAIEPPPEPPPPEPPARLRPPELPEVQGGLTARPIPPPAPESAKMVKGDIIAPAPIEMLGDVAVDPAFAGGPGGADEPCDG